MNFSKSATSLLVLLSMATTPPAQAQTVQDTPRAVANSYIAAIAGDTTARLCNKLVGGFDKDVAFFSGPAAKGRALLRSGGMKNSQMKAIDDKQITGMTRELKSRSSKRQVAYCNADLRKWKRKVKHR